MLLSPASPGRVSPMAHPDRKRTREAQRAIKAFAKIVEEARREYEERDCPYRLTPPGKP